LNTASYTECIRHHREISQESSDCGSGVQDVWNAKIAGTWFLLHVIKSWALKSLTRDNFSSKFVPCWPASSDMCSPDFCKLELTMRADGGVSHTMVPKLANLGTLN
jgi:hypothetical protein